jgi:uncharacterized membrane protein YfcA
MPQLAVWSWIGLLVAAMLVGYAKTAVNGVASIAIVIFAAILPAKESTGTLLPLLIAGDLMAIWVYRRHADWSLIARLLPWILVGLIVGALFVARVDNHVMRVAIGVLLLVLLAAQVVSSRRTADVEPDHRAHPLLASATGTGTGFATMVANASGPIMTLYLLASGYAVVELVGAAAWLFFIVNLIKVPFSIGLGLLHPGSVAVDALLLPALGLGGWLGAITITHISRQQFERYVLVLVAVSALLLLV